MSTISLFTGGRAVVVPRPDELVARAAQALSAIGVHRERLTASLARLTGLEVHDAVTLRDLAHVGQRFEMTNRLADEAATYIAGAGRGRPSACPAAARPRRRPDPAVLAGAARLRHRRTPRRCRSPA
jgi:DNA integrity scanning protein DisA with diadenylate cyclase activity